MADFGVCTAGDSLDTPFFRSQCDSVTLTRPGNWTIRWLKQLLFRLLNAGRKWQRSTTKRQVQTMCSLRLIRFQPISCQTNRESRKMTRQITMQMSHESKSVVNRNALLSANFPIRSPCHLSADETDLAMERFWWMMTIDEIDDDNRRNRPWLNHSFVPLQFSRLHKIRSTR